jgi:hypothetical protein
VHARAPNVLRAQRAPELAEGDPPCGPVFAEWNTICALGATPRGSDAGGVNGAAPFGGAAISAGAKPAALEPFPATVPTTCVPCVAKS